MPARVIGPSHHGQMMNSVSSITNDSPSDETPSVCPPAEPFGDLLAGLVGCIEIVVAGTSNEPGERAQATEIFPYHHGLRSPVHDRCELEMVSGQDHHIEIGGDLQHPIELRERVMKIGDRKEAHGKMSSKFHAGERSAFDAR